MISKVGNFYILPGAFRKIETVTCNEPEAGRSVLLDDEDVLSDPTPAVATAVLLNPTLSGIFFWRINTKYGNRRPDETLTIGFFSFYQGCHTLIKAKFPCFLSGYHADTPITIKAEAIPQG